MKTKIDWARGADIRVRDATHNGGEWTLETVRVGPSGVRETVDELPQHPPSSDSGSDDAGRTGDARAPGIDHPLGAYRSIEHTPPALPTVSFPLDPSWDFQPPPRGDRS
jgi:hypothetical protein